MTSTFECSKKWGDYPGSHGVVVLENYPPVFFDRNQKPAECRYQLDLEPQYRIQGSPHYHGR